MKQVVFYRRNNDTCPVEEFIDTLSAKQAQKVLWVLKLFEDLDYIPSQYWKKLKNTDGIWEVRIQFSGNIFRLLGFEENGNFVILTNGFAKKSQKTPKSEIELATKRKKEFKERRK